MMETQAGLILESRNQGCDQLIKINNYSDCISNCMTSDCVENEPSTSFSDEVCDSIMIQQQQLISEQIIVLDENKQCNNNKIAVMFADSSTSYTLHYKCDICQTMFTTPANLAYHYLQHAKGKYMERRKIEECNLKARALYARLRVETGAEFVYQCDRCPENFKFPTRLALHYGDHFEQSEDLHASEKDDNTSAINPKRPYAHLQIGTGENAVYKCDKCEMQLKDIRSFSMHYNTHLDLMKVQSFLGDQQSEQAAFYRKRSSDKPYICELCGRILATKGILRCHLKIHTRNNPYICEHCGKTLATKGNLKCHLRIHTGERPYVCKQCSKSFTTQSSLRIHARVHKPEQLCQCQLCGKTFGYKSALAVHLRRHAGDKPYKCDMCSMAFLDSGYLIVHRRTHTGERPYICTYCGKGFIDIKHKTIHTRIHTGHKPYKCKICPDKAFVQSMQLKLHMRTHHGTKTK